MAELGGRTVLDTLTRHFFWRFFQTDNVGEGDASETPVVRALAVVAVPMLMAAFWIVTLAGRMSVWQRAGVHALFVVYAFCSMGCVTALQWRRLFPERTDFLILLPLPLRPSILFLAKLRAVAVFLLLFVVAGSISGTVLLPAIAGGSIFRAMVVHGVVTMGAGAAACLVVLALEAALIAVTPVRWFRFVAPAVQTMLVAFFLLVFLRVGTFGEWLPELFNGGVRGAVWFPPLWFEAAYEVLIGAGTATPFAHVLALHALYCFPVLCLAVLSLYPLAWTKRRRDALEGAHGLRLRDGIVWALLLHRTVLRGADERAVFHFARQTILRMSQYHVLLAAYSGSGLALASTFALSVAPTPGHLHVQLWRTGMEMVVPLLLFWTAAGMRVAFLLPTDLAARWVFRLAPLRTRRVVSTTKLLVFATSLTVLSVILVVLALSGWSAPDVLLQGVFGAMYALVLTDIFFYGQSHVPFTRPRLPGRSSVPLTAAVFVFGVPTCMVLAVTLERWVGFHMLRMWAVVAAVAVFHAVQRWLRGLPSHSVSENPFLGENDRDVQTLGLSA